MAKYRYSPLRGYAKPELSRPKPDDPEFKGDLSSLSPLGFGAITVEPAAELRPIEGVGLRQVPLPLLRALRQGRAGVHPGIAGVDRMIGSSAALALRDAIRGWHRSLVEHDPGAGSLGQFEASHLIKYIPLNGWYPGWDVTPESLIRDLDPPPFPDWVIALVKEAVGGQRMVGPRMKLKKFTNHGDPSWGTSIPDHAAHLLLAGALAEGRETVSSAFRKLSGLIDRVGLPDDVPVMTPFSRAGENRKPVTLIRPGPLGPIAIASVTGVFCRRRVVRGYSTAVNEAVREGVTSAQQTLKARGPWYDHSSPDLTMRKLVARSGDIWSDDASSFDQTADFRHLLQIQQAYSGHLTPQEASILREALEHPAAGAPLQSTDAGFLYTRRGTIASGIVSTTLDGTLLNLAIILACLGASVSVGPMGVAEAWRNGSLLVLVQGDDSLLRLPAGWELDKERYVARATELGYTRKLERYPVFLMRWYDIHSGASYNSAARALIRSATRERLAAGPFSELYGALARFRLCDGNPHRDEAFSILAAHSELLQDVGVRSVSDLTAFCANEASLRAYEDELAGAPGGFDDEAEVNVLLGTLGDVLDDAMIARLRLRAERLSGYRDDIVAESEFEALSWPDAFRRVAKGSATIFDTIHQEIV